MLLIDGLPCTQTGIVTGAKNHTLPAGICFPSVVPCAAEGQAFLLRCSEFKQQVNPV